MGRRNDGTDDGSVYAGQPANRVSRRRVYDGTNVHLVRPLADVWIKHCYVIN